MLSIKKALKNILTELHESEWIYAGYASNTGTVTVPDTATEIMVVITAGGTTMTNTAIRDSLNSRWELGGYYITANDWGLTNVNVSNNNRTFQIRNCRYGSQDLKSSATITVYYKERPVRSA